MGIIVSALTALTGAGTATNDELPIVDTSAVVTKKITIAELLIGLGALPLAGGTMTGNINTGGNNIQIGGGYVLGNHAALSYDGHGLRLSTIAMVRFTEGDSLDYNVSTALSHSASGVLELNNGTAGTFRDLKLRELLTAAGTTGQASINVPHGVAPTSPVDGDLWSTTAGLFIRISGVTKTVTLT